MGLSGEFVTYAQLEDRSSRLARALRARGVHEGDTIAILMENNRQYLEVAWAAQRSGLRYTAINNHLRPAEAQYVLDDCGAVALFSSEAMADVVDVEMGEAVKAVVQPIDPASAGPGAEGGTACLLPRATGDVQVPAHDRLHRPAPEGAERQVLQAPAARATGRARLIGYLRSASSRSRSVRRVLVAAARSPVSIPSVTRAIHPCARSSRRLWMARPAGREQQRCPLVVRVLRADQQPLGDERVGDPLHGLPRVAEAAADLRHCRRPLGIDDGGKHQRLRAGKALGLPVGTVHGGQPGRGAG